MQIGNAKETPNSRTSKVGLCRKGEHVSFCGREMNVGREFMGGDGLGTCHSGRRS